jgi:hypothetical protein
LRLLAGEIRLSRSDKAENTTVAYTDGEFRVRGIQTPVPFVALDVG